MVSAGALSVVLFGKQVGENLSNPVGRRFGSRFSTRWGKMGRIADRAAARPPCGGWRRNMLTIDRDYEFEGGSRPISRVLSRATIHLGRASPRASSDLPGNSRGPRVRALRPACFPIWSCSRWGLPCRRMLPPARCALTAPFHPCRRHIAAALGRSALCCTFRGLAPPRRYLAPCPVEPGLSSAKGAAVAWPTPAPIIQARSAAAALDRRVPCADAR